jgi:hypothetical protein
METCLPQRKTNSRHSGVYNECHSLFNQWKTKGLESIIYDEANKQTVGHFENNLNQGNMDDDVSVGSETLQPDLEAHQADGTQVGASDGMSCLTDPTSPNLAFTLPQMATRINPFPYQLLLQASGNVEESNRHNESLAENSEEDEEHDFGQGINEYNEYIADDPFMNPEIDGHV